MTSGGRAAGIEAEQAEIYEIIGGAAGGLLLLCDHATNALPATCGTLGLAAGEFERHIAYDIGAAGVTRHLSGLLGAPAVLTRFSRLLIDPNRGEDDPTFIMRLSDGAIIPGNRHLDAAERQQRIVRYYRPYHDAIGRVIEPAIAAGHTPVLIGMHSFTERWKGVDRPWQVGVLWERDRRVAMPLLEALRAEGDLVVGDNEPFPGQYEGDTMWRHGTQRGLPFCSIEIRQDLIRDETGQRAWAERLARILGSIVCCNA